VACMRMVWSVLGVASVAVLLSGCLPPQPVLAPTADPTSTPIFASDGEALAAAEAAYGAYLAVSDQIAADGGADAERIAPLVTREWLPSELDAFAKFGLSGRRQVGATQFSNASLQQLFPVSIYVCVNTSNTGFVDVSGKDVTPTGRQTSFTFSVEFESQLADPSLLLLANAEPWSGASSC